MIAAAENRLVEKMKQDVVVSFAGADAIATRVAYLFADPKKRRQDDIVMPWDRFPTLFEDKQEEIRQKQLEAEQARYKAEMIAFADRWNRRNENGSENDI